MHANRRNGAIPSTRKNGNFYPHETKQKHPMHEGCNAKLTCAMMVTTRTTTRRGNDNAGNNRSRKKKGKEMSALTWTSCLLATIRNGRPRSKLFSSTPSDRRHIYTQRKKKQEDETQSHKRHTADEQTWAKKTKLWSCANYNHKHAVAKAVQKLSDHLQWHTLEVGQKKGSMTMEAAGKLRKKELQCKGQ